MTCGSFRVQGASAQPGSQGARPTARVTGWRQCVAWR